MSFGKKPKDWKIRKELEKNVHTDHWKGYGVPCASCERRTTSYSGSRIPNETETDLM